MRYYIFILCILTIFTFSSYGQDKSGNFTPIYESDNSGITDVKLYTNGMASKQSPWYFGGDLNLSFGTYSYIGISPLIGYRISPMFHLGAQITYQHAWDDTYSVSTQSDMYGGNLFARFYPVREFFLSLEPAIYSYKSYSSTTVYSNETVPFIYAGAGANYFITSGAFLTFEIKVDMLRDSNSPYGNEWHPIYTAGVGFGL